MKKKIGSAVALFAIAGVAQAQPTDFLDLGVIGGEGTYSFDTTGSTNHGGGDLDTEIGLWDAAGTLLAADDDGLGFPFSIVTEDLTAGVYWIGISEFNSVFEDGWVNSGSAFEADESGTTVLNINGVFAGQKDAGDEATTGLPETAFYKVTVVPAPASLALLGLGGLAAARRRR